jgi:hypothetical protein
VVTDSVSPGTVPPLIARAAVLAGGGVGLGVVGPLTYADSAQEAHDDQRDHDGGSDVRSAQLRCSYGTSCWPDP